MVSQRDMVTDHVGGVPGRNMVTDHVIRKLTEQQQRIVAAGRTGRHRHQTNPDNPRAVNQRYILTEAGIALRAARTGWTPRPSGPYRGSPLRRFAHSSNDSSTDRWPATVLTARGARR